MAERILASEARRRLPELMGRARYGGERFILERRGQPMAAVVRMEDLMWLEKAEAEGELPSPDWEAALEQATVFRERVQARRRGEPGPDSAELLRELREERSGAA